MNITKRRMFPALLTILLFATLLAGCAGKQSDAGQNDASQNDASQKEITCAADLEGARIGVQLGTTGDIYVSDYEGDEAGTKIERYNKN